MLPVPDAVSGVRHVSDKSSRVGSLLVLPRVQSSESGDVSGGGAGTVHAGIAGNTIRRCANLTLIINNLCTDMHACVDIQTVPITWHFQSSLYTATL